MNLNICGRASRYDGLTRRVLRAKRGTGEAQGATGAWVFKDTRTRHVEVRRVRFDQFRRYSLQC